MTLQVKTAFAVPLAVLAGTVATWPITGNGCGCVFPVALAVMVVVGVPFALRFFGPKTRWWQAALAGLLIGATPFLLLHGYWAWGEWGHRQTDMPLRMRMIYSGAVCGSVAAVVFWWLGARQFFGSDGERPEQP